ncbi:MAG TPA: FAD-dependent oxidoreductase [Thermoanaerobaculaceae bacterium]|nr:FAD-dependent oxidoreductase [Thermoanaerobaculaceae bacterium]HRS15194.1 FAD-dependent oxidoreductase [Thermoanaerobaculaceae bacterium]
MGMRVVVVGGVAAGMSAACRLRRLDEHAEIVVLERGPHVSYASCGLPYHISGTICDRDRLLVATPEMLAARYALDVRVEHEAVAIDRPKREVVVRDRRTAREYRLPYDRLLLAPGAAPARLPIPGADHPRVLTLRSLADMDAILAAVAAAAPQKAVVVGAGYIGLELAEALCFAGLEATLVEAMPQVLPAADPEMAVLLEHELERNGVDLCLGTRVTAIETRGEGLAVRLSSGDELEAGLVVVAAGVRPEVDLAREAGLECGPSGGIAVDNAMRTSDEAILAAGDAVEVVDVVTGAPALVPLAGPASRQGRIAADTIAGRSSVYRGSQGTVICKVFELAIGMTGRSETALAAAGVPHEKVYIFGGDHASYYPGAAPLYLKLLFDPRDGRILGAQAVGSRGVDRRIDVLAVALRAGLTVEDLEHLELCYAPPFGSARDPVNLAGFAAAGARGGDVALADVREVAHPRPGQLVLDVRTGEEVAQGAIPGALHIPVDELRGRLGELPRDRELLVVCAVGQRGYVACRLLAQHGFACRNLSGGFALLGLWKRAQRRRAEAPAPTGQGVPQ